MDDSRTVSLPSSPVESSETILILSPTGRDALLATTVLDKAGLDTKICDTMEQLCAEIAGESGASFHLGVVLIAEEALQAGREQKLLDTLSQQPPWSDIPIVLLTSSGESEYANVKALTIFGSSGNVTLLERPLKAITLVSAMQAALRSRRRQYEIRDLIEERERALISISRAREQAEDANKMKDQFLATLSHELRTPLNAILGWALIIREELEAGLEEQNIELYSQGIEVIERNARIQAQLIEDLLDVSRIISGKLLLEHTPIDPKRVIIAAADAIAPQAEANGVTIELKLGARIPNVLGDAARLQQIVWNLLSNAVKFTPAGGKIFLELSREGTSVKIVVRDTGIGINPKFLPFAFERFRQADASSTRKQGGLGLGLSIVRQLVEMHKGTVSVDSAGEGKGTTFTIIIPATDLLVDGEDKIAPVDNTTTARKSLRTTYELDGVRILVVDNEPDARDLIKRLLVESHADVAVAESVAQAMDVARRYKPDLLISDIGMPNEDGYDLIRKIRQSEDGLSSIPAIALTAYASMEDKQKARHAGFQMHLAKPVDPDELRAVVRELT